jgi:hypothetical protein
MGRPCGCSGECGCTYVGVNGIVITGSGTTRDPGRVGLADVISGTGCDSIMGCVGSHVGTGMRYDPTAKHIFTSISSDGGNNIVYGTDGGLFSAGGSGSGDSGYATVDGLVAKTTPFIGGSYGAGLSMVPEGPIQTYQTAMDLDLDLIHVPVRRSREQFCLVQGSRQMGDYSYHFAGNTTDEMDLAMARRMVYIPGGDPSGDFSLPDYAAQDGYFGYSEPWHQGTPLLSDVFELVQRRTVLYLEVKDIGAGANDVPSPSLTYPILKSLILKYAMTKSVIVASEFPLTATSDELSQITAGLQSLRDIGCAVGAHLTTDAEVDAVTPANLVAAGMTWVGISYPTADTRPAVVKAYKDAGLHVLLFGVHRQWQWNLVNDTTTFGAGGLKGVLCADPVYVAGAINNYRYRTTTATWDWNTPDYGRHSNWSNTIDGQRDRYRGYVIDGDTGNISLDGDVLLPTDTSPSAYRPSGYYILQGEQCPAPLNATTGHYDNYDIDVGFIWDSLVGDSDSWMGIWFGNPEDRMLYEWTQCDTHTKGYQYQLDQAGMQHMSRYDGVPNAVAPPYAYNADWGSPWTGHIAAHTEYRVKVRVRPTYITCGPANQPETGPDVWTFTNTFGGGTLWRGPYIYLGRHFAFTSDSTRCRFRNLVITPQP